MSGDQKGDLTKETEEMRRERRKKMREKIGRERREI